MDLVLMKLMKMIGMFMRRSISEYIHVDIIEGEETHIGI
jgi:hypothetical protein